MIARVQRLPRWQRLFVFLMVMIGFIFAMAAVTLFIVVQSATYHPRTVAVPMADGVVVAEFAALPDDDAYPAALAILPDGTLVTGSYASGVLWRISPDGEVSEVTGTRDVFGSISGLDADAGGTLYVLDRLDPLALNGIIVWAVEPDGHIGQLLSLDRSPASLLALPNDIAADPDGNLYLTDSGHDTILKLAPGETLPVVWWSSGGDDDTSFEPIGLAYDPVGDAILVTDGLRNTITRIPRMSDDPVADAQLLYAYDRETGAPGLDGITTGPDGEIFVAALGMNRAGRLDGDSITWLAGAFRGASDVAYDPQRDRLYVANWDQSSLIPMNLIFLQVQSQPRLPFAIDSLSPAAAAR
jgi:sugar lactone lactonase YvrE